MISAALVFPGQGSQLVGMGKQLAMAYPAARLVFEEVDEALNQSLSRIIFEGPIEELTLTANTQPALMAVSVAIMRVLERECGVDISKFVKFVAGHSLGEYSSLAVAKSFDIATAAHILRARGTAMQEAVPLGEGSMAAILGVGMDTVEEIVIEAREGNVCSIANDNSNGQIVISGAAPAVNRAMEIAKMKGAKRSILLPVSAPFHCSMMASAADVMASELATVAIQKPVIPVVQNVTAKSQTEPDEIRQLLIEQVTNRVRWRESILFMRDNGVEMFIEIGAGKVLTGLTRRIDQSLKSISIQTPDDINAFLESL